MNLLEQLISRAKQDVKTIVLPEGSDIRTIKAASLILKQGIANIVILGDIDTIRKNAGD